MKHISCMDLVEDPLSLSGEDILEPLEVRIRVDDRLELLERELVSLEHRLDDVFVEAHLVLLEEVNQLVDVERA